MANENIRDLDLPELQRLCNLLNIEDGRYRKTLYLHKHTGVSIKKACEVTSVCRETFHRYLSRVDSKIGRFLKVVGRG